MKNQAFIKLGVEKWTTTDVIQYTNQASGYIDYETANRIMEPVVAFLNSSSVDQQLNKQQFAVYSGDCDHYFDDAPQIDLEKVNVIKHDSCVSFGEAFNSIQFTKIRHDLPQRLSVGFFVPQLNDLHLCKFRDIHHYWHPQSEKELEHNPKDSNLGQFYKTTSQHFLGGGWIGKVELNQPQLSTTFGGSRNSIQPDVDKYIIRWLKWADQKSHYQPFSKRALTLAKDTGEIVDANPDEMQPLRRPTEPQLDWNNPGHVHVSKSCVPKPAKVEPEIIEVAPRNWFVRLVKRLFRL